MPRPFRPRSFKLDGHEYLTYRDAARLVGTTLACFQTNWVKEGWVRPSPMRQGSYRFIDRAELTLARRRRARYPIGHLYTPPEAAAFLQVSQRRFQAFVRQGSLAPALPRSDLFAFEDLERVLLHLRGIPDPIGKGAAAALAGFTRASTLDTWLEPAKLTVVSTHARRAWLSKSAVLRFAHERARQRLELQRGLRSGRLLTPPDAAKRLGISLVMLYRLLADGRLTARRFPFLKEHTAVTTAAVRQLQRSQAVRGPRTTGLDPKFLTTSQVASLLGVKPATVLHYVHTARLHPVSRGKWGKKAAYGFDPKTIEARRPKACELK